MCQLYFDHWFNSFQACVLGCLSASSSQAFLTMRGWSACRTRCFVIHICSMFLLGFDCLCIFVCFLQYGSSMYYLFAPCW